MKPEPHHAHLAEMRADRADPIATIAAVPCRALTGAELRDARWRNRLRILYPDPTRRHLMEMRLLILEQRHADGLIGAREVNARHPDGARRLMAAARKEGGVADVSTRQAPMVDFFPCRIE